MKRNKPKDYNSTFMIPSIMIRKRQLALVIEQNFPDVQEPILEEFDDIFVVILHEESINMIVRWGIATLPYWLEQRRDTNIQRQEEKRINYLFGVTNIQEYKEMQN